MPIVFSYHPGSLGPGLPYPGINTLVPSSVDSCLFKLKVNFGKYHHSMWDFNFFLLILETERKGRREEGRGNRGREGERERERKRELVVIPFIYAFVG